MVSLAETPLTGEPDAGNPPVRFGGRGGAQAPSLPLSGWRWRDTAVLCLELFHFEVPGFRIRLATYYYELACFCFDDGRLLGCVWHFPAQRTNGDERRGEWPL